MSTDECIYLQYLWDISVTHSDLDYMKKVNRTNEAMLHIY